MPQYIRQSYLGINYSQRERTKTRPSTTIEKCYIKLGHSYFWTLLYKINVICLSTDLKEDRTPKFVWIFGKLTKLYLLSSYTRVTRITSLILTLCMRIASHIKHTKLSLLSLKFFMVWCRIRVSWNGMTLSYMHGHPKVALYYILRYLDGAVSHTELL